MMYWFIVCNLLITMESCFLDISVHSSFCPSTFCIPVYFLPHHPSAVPPRLGESAVWCRRKVRVSSWRDRGEVWHMPGWLSLAGAGWLQVSNVHSHWHTRLQWRMNKVGYMVINIHWKKKSEVFNNSSSVLNLPSKCPKPNFISLQSKCRQEDLNISVWHRCELVTFLSVSTSLCQIQF